MRVQPSRSVASTPGRSRNSSGVNRRWSTTCPSSSNRRSRFQDRYRRRDYALILIEQETGMRISAKRLAQCQDFLGVQDLVVGGEELLDGLLVDLHLGSPHPHPGRVAG